MSPILFGEGTWDRDHWEYFTETELAPGAIRVGHWKAVFNQRGDNGAQAGQDAPGAELGWRGPGKQAAVVPAIYNLWEDPQERYDIFMTNWTEHTWVMITISDEIKKLMKTYVQYPPRKLQSGTYTGPIEISKYEQFQWVRDQLAKEGVSIPLPTGN